MNFPGLSMFGQGLVSAACREFLGMVGYCRQLLLPTRMAPSPLSCSPVRMQYMQLETEGQFLKRGQVEDHSFIQNHSFVHSFIHQKNIY